jgi:hypothetical protein
MHSDPFTTLTQQWLALWDPRPLRQRWLAEMSNVMDRFMRSPAFAELIRFNMVTMTRSAGLVVPFLRR